MAAGVVAVLGPAAVRTTAEDNYLTLRRQKCAALLTQWKHASESAERARLGAELCRAAVLAERPALVEEVAADGKLAQKELKVPRRASVVPLHELRTFEGIQASLNDENVFDKGWLVRRITRDAWEVWTPTHGWLFDGGGRLINEAQPTRGDGTGREWFGAFLPDGRWVTTDLQENDATLTFFSRDGQRLRQVTSAELAPPGPNNPKRSLIGWARSDKDGAAWVVNVGSEQGYATVRVGPEGPACVLGGIERWQLCYPRSLGPRGWYITMSVPDDAGQALLTREEAGHGSFVGFPSYGFGAAEDFSLGSFVRTSEGRLDPAEFQAGVTLPDGNSVFGFWPGGQDVFIGTETTGEAGTRDAAHTRKADTGEHWDERRGEMNELPVPVVDKTWFFTRHWQIQGWARARRLADGAEGGTMLLRMNDDGRIVTLKPDLGVAAIRHFIWSDVTTADAFTIYDDLRLGLFVRGHRLVLAGW